MTKTKTLPPQNLQQIPAAVAPRPTKTALLRVRLANPGGASLTELMQLTGWQAHTLRAALSGLRKAGLIVTRRRDGAETIYAIDPANPAPRDDGGAGQGAETDDASPGMTAPPIPPCTARGLPDDAISQPGKGAA